jgi:hypothetical protein
MKKQPFGNPFDPKYDMKEYIEWRHENVFTDEFAEEVMDYLKKHGKLDEDTGEITCQMRTEDGVVDLSTDDWVVVSYFPPREADYIFIDYGKRPIQFAG